MSNECGRGEKAAMGTTDCYAYRRHTPLLTKCGHFAWLISAISTDCGCSACPLAMAASAASLPTTRRFSILKFKNWSTDLRVPVMATSFLSSIVMGWFVSVLKNEKMSCARGESG